MKARLLFGLLLAALWTAPAPAQHSIGALKIGGAVSYLSGEATSDFDPRTGLAAGVAFGYDFGNGLAVIPEALYVVKGAYADGEISNVPIRARFDLTYLEVPVLLSYRFANRSRFEPRIFAGPMISYNLEARITYRAADRDGPSQSDEDTSIQSLDYGATAGVGLGFDVSGQRVVAEVRGQLGQANVREVEPELHNVGITFFLGLEF